MKTSQTARTAHNIPKPGSDKQLEYWRNCDHRWNVKTGATRSGKTYMDYFLIPKRLLDVRGKAGANVILGNTRETVRRNVILPMQNIYGSGRIGNIRADNSCYMFGERVFILGADNAGHTDRIRGMSIKYCYGDEVTTWSEEVFDMLKSRLDKPYSCFDGTCNPDSPNHWFKKFLESDADIYQQHYRIDDNPFLTADFINNLKKEYAGTVYYDRYIEGLWALAEGLIYPMYEDALVDAVPEGDPDGICMSIDYGTMNAFACMLYEKHGGIWYGVRDYYYSGRDTGIQKTDGEYLADIQERFSDVIGDCLRKIAASRETGALAHKIEVIIDPSAASFIALLRKCGWAKVRPADNDVLNGIRETASALNTGKLKILRSIKAWSDEAGGYVWDDSAGEEHPVKINDHCVTGDTLIDTTDGQVTIRELVGKTGDVYCYDEENHRKTISRFHDVRITQSNAKVYKVTLKDGTIIRATGDHPVLTNNGWKKIYDLNGCDAIHQLIAEKAGSIMKPAVAYVGVLKIEEDGAEDVYNMEVDDYHNYSVNGGFIIHNCMDQMRYMVKTKHLVKRQ